MKKIVKTIIKKLSRKNQDLIFKFLSKFYFICSYIPFFSRLDSLRFAKFVYKDYGPFGKKQRIEVMLSAARFLNINRPIQGHYFEFGSHGANTIRYAYKYLSFFINGYFVAFDSFKGLPEVSKDDASTIFFKGNLTTPLENFRKLATKRNGVPVHKLVTIEGFYSDTLNKATAKDLGDLKASVIYVDCDLYESTRDVLTFSFDFFQQGTVLIFDDWNCYKASPNRGERRAFYEFCSNQNRFTFVPFFTSAEIQGFICQDNNFNGM